MASPLTRRLAALTASGASIIALALTPLSGAQAAEETSTLTLLNINDFHGRISSNIALGLANTIQTERAAAAGQGGSLLLSAGDNVGASLYASSVQDDQPTLEYLNALGLEASAVGNHEFDRGMDDLLNRIIPASSFTYLGANVLNAQGEPALDPYYITEVEGTTVAVIGVVTTETPQLTDPSRLAGLTFADPVATVNQYASQLSDGKADNGEADVIIAEYHEGVDTSNTGTDQIINQTSPAVDAIFTGHTHQTYVLDAPVPGQEGKTRPVIQTGNYGDNLGKVVLTLDSEGQVSSYKAELLARLAAPTAEQIDADPVLAHVTGLITEANDYATMKGSVEVGQLTAPITTGYDPTKGSQGGFDVRNYESTMGHLVADMYLAAANSTGRTPADLGIVNPGGLRDELPGGLRTSLGLAINQKIRVMDLVNVTPFANNLWTTELTGAQLKQVLEEQWQQTADGQMAARPYLQLGLSSNVTYTYTGSADAEGYASRGSHILDIYVNGVKVEADDRFTVAIPSFLLGGGDNFTTLAQGSNPKDTALVDSDAFISYVEQAGTLSPRAAKQAVRVEGLAESYSTDGKLTLSLSDLNVRSFGAPTLSELRATLGGRDIGTVAVAQDGSAELSLDLAGKGLSEGIHELVLSDTSGTTGTQIHLSLTLVASSTQPSPEPTEPTPSPSVEPTASPSVEPTASASAEPTASASAEPTASASAEPTASASPEATIIPAEEAPVASQNDSSSTLTPLEPVFEYKNCAAVWADLGRPINEGERGFHAGLDADGDKTGCERNPDYSNLTEDGSYVSSWTSGGATGSYSSSSSYLAQTGFGSLGLLALAGLGLLAGAGLILAGRSSRA